MSIMVISIILATWIAIGVCASVTGYRCGKKAAIREMGLVEQWHSFHRDRRNGFAEVNREMVGDNAPIAMRGASVTPQEYTAGTAAHVMPPRIPGARPYYPKVKKSR